MDLRFTYRFEAAHRFLNAHTKCSTPHGHTWVATLVLKSKVQKLDHKSMVEDFAVLKKDWREFVEDVLDHSYLHNQKDSVAIHLKKESPELRLLPFPGDPTTEMVSLLCFHKMEVMIKHRQLQDLVSVNKIILQETPTNSIELDLVSKNKLFEPFAKLTGWWLDPELSSRILLTK